MNFSQFLKEGVSSNFFFLMFKLNNIDQLKKYRLKGVKGITDNSDMVKIFWRSEKNKALTEVDRPGLLIMPKREVLKLNDVEQIRYTPEGLLHDNAKMLIRIVYPESKMSRYFLAMIIDDIADDRNIDIEPHNLDTDRFQTFEDFKKIYMSATGEDEKTFERKVTEWADWHRKEFGHESEWLVLDQVLRIPKSSKIRIRGDHDIEDLKKYYDVKRV